MSGDQVLSRGTTLILPSSSRAQFSMLAFMCVPMIYLLVDELADILALLPRVLAKQKALAALSALLLPIIAFIKIGQVEGLGTSWYAPLIKHSCLSLTRIIKARFAR
jgi:hypothetical protein